MAKSKKKDMEVADIDEIVISHSDLRRALESAYYSGHQTGRDAATHEIAELEAEFNLTVNS
jgi:hypothetical protein